MRRLAVLFAILAAANTVEHIVLSGKLNGVIEAPRRDPPRADLPR